jgi:methylenetetrahydrofolate reductase (NADPH)
MRFAQIYATRRRPIISFEVYPPKPETTLESFRGVLTRLVELRPDFMTVTYGAGGSTRGRTVEIASILRREFAMEAACHLTCVGSTAADIGRTLGEIRAAEGENIVALRGDPPQGQAVYTPPPGEYRHARQLVEHIRGTQDFGVAVATYPEKHLEATDLETDLRRFREKASAGADIAITQLFYDNRFYFDLVERTRALGIEIPIIPGILPILGLQQVKRITGMCGASIPPALLGYMEAAAADGEKAMEVGICHAILQARELLEKGVPGIHFYVLNKSKHMVRILAELRPILNRMEAGETAGERGAAARRTRSPGSAGR